MKFFTNSLFLFLLYVLYPMVSLGGEKEKIENLSEHIGDSNVCSLDMRGWSVKTGQSFNLL